MVEWRRLVRLVFAALVLAGCTGETNLLLDLSLAPGLAQPDTLQVSLFAQGLVGTPQRVSLAAQARTLPGRLVVSPLDASLPNPRILVDGLDAKGILIAQAASPVQLTQGRQSELALELTSPLTDSDGDGVPDVIDDCPSLPDPDQRCAANDGAVPGDLGGDGAMGDLRRGPACPTPNLFCDDFESGSTSKWNDVSVKGKTTLGVDGTQAFSGSFALDVTSQPNMVDLGVFQSENATVGLNMTPTGLPTLAARAYVRTATNPGSYALFMALFANTAGWAVGVDGSGHWVVTQDQGNSPDLTTNVTMPLGQWVCVELIVDPPSVMNPAGRLRLLTDGSPIIDTTPSSFTAPTLFDVGLVRSPGNVSSQVFIDDVVLANQPIGCE
jgi:hypothetical protein